MVMLAEHYDYVIGGDPDRDTVDLAVVDTATGGVRAHLVDQADGSGYARMLAWAQQHAPGRRVWALEGTGSFASGLVTALAEAGEDVVRSPAGNAAAVPRTTASTPSRPPAPRCPASSRRLPARGGCGRRYGWLLLPGKRFWSAGRRRSTN